MFAVYATPMTDYHFEERTCTCKEGMSIFIFYFLEGCNSVVFSSDSFSVRKVRSGGVLGNLLIGKSEFADPQRVETFPPTQKKSQEAGIPQCQIIGKE